MTRVYEMTLLTALAALVGAGCSSLECGPGTVEKVDPATGRAQCVAASATSIPCDVDGGAQIVGGVCQGDPGKFPTCGAGTVLDPASGTCVATDDGSTTRPPPCPTPDANHICVNGVVRFLVDGNYTAGTTFEVRAYDPIAFLFMPDTTAPLATTTTDAKGTYVLPNLSPPGTGLIAVAVIDPGTNHQYALSAAGAKDLQGGKSYQVDPYAVPASVVAGWDTQAGYGGADGFVGKGAYVALFMSGPGDSAHPVEGVTLTFGNMPAPDRFYFGSDRATLDSSLTATGAATGSAVQRVTPGMLGSYSGSGGGITWEQVLGSSTSGVVFVQRFQPAP